ncbi:hypothetical protein CDAR_93041 [Caerostris darwini]|uniref:Uncharacterized protein n=1 Tax=Caerostris darwini TaxID=1538125 RepID=A0AAV4WF27_9ARAC|nr:hypothetical protein CDAR_93041 [Caerostris darwini]
MQATGPAQWQKRGEELRSFYSAMHLMKNASPQESNSVEIKGRAIFCRRTSGHKNDQSCLWTAIMSQLLLISSAVHIPAGQTRLSAKRKDVLVGMFWIFSFMLNAVREQNGQ